MAGGRVPVFQSNALPLTSLTTTAAGGDLTQIGKTITRHWNSVAVGLPYPGAGTRSDSNVIDSTGCTQFVLVVTLSAFNGGAGIPGATVTSYARLGDQAGNFPDQPGIPLSNMITFGTLTGYNAIAAGSSATFNIMWSTTELGGHGIGTDTTMTNRFKIRLDWPGAPGAGQGAMNAELWGGSV